jgi:hypothetical protein
MTSEAIVWSLKGHIQAVSRDHIVYRNDGLGVQKETVTPKRGLKSGRPRTRYYIDEDPREFRSEDEMVRALREQPLQSISNGGSFCGTDSKKETL